MYILGCDGADSFLPQQPIARGMTLTELMIATALIGIGVLAAVASFRGINQAIQASKGRTLATNIAQEKMQILMQKSYYEVLVTSAAELYRRTSPARSLMIRAISHRKR